MDGWGEIRLNLGFEELGHEVSLTMVILSLNRMSIKNHLLFHNIMLHVENKVPWQKLEIVNGFEIRRRRIPSPLRVGNRSACRLRKRQCRNGMEEELSGGECYKRG